MSKLILISILILLTYIYAKIISMNIILELFLMTNL